MTNVIQSIYLVVIALCGWFSSHQQKVIDYLIEENRILKDQFEGQRLRFTDARRIRASPLIYSTHRAGSDIPESQDIAD